MNKLTACPLDCYDACQVVCKDTVPKPNNDQITNGKLCKLFGYLLNEDNLTTTDTTKLLKQVANKLKEPNQKVLYYKGSGNMGVMQHIPKQFFNKIGATITTGSLCDGAGEAGIEMGREVAVNPPLDELLKAEVIIVWGRNLTVTSSHIYRLIQNKTFITIDPRVTKIATLSDIHLQITPKGDMLLANLLYKGFIEDEEATLLHISSDDFYDLLKILETKKVVFLLGLGAQKYFYGADIFHSIEKLAFSLSNLVGVWYIANSAYPFENKIIPTLKNTTPIASVNFNEYDIIFIQGANPAISAPNSSSIIDALEKKFVIFFGTTFNETAKYANIIIPAKTFLQKDDVRLSYGHDQVTFCKTVQSTTKAVSEYEFTQFMFQEFDFDGLLSIQEYLEPFKTITNPKPIIDFKNCDTIDVRPQILDVNQYYLITAKYSNSLNSQFKVDPYAYVHPNLGLSDNQFVRILSDYGIIQIKVKNDSSLHPKSILIYSGNPKVNILTPNKISQKGNNAIFQEVILTLKAPPTRYTNIDEDGVITVTNLKGQRKASIIVNNFYSLLTIIIMSVVIIWYVNYILPEQKKINQKYNKIDYRQQQIKLSHKLHKEH